MLIGPIVIKASRINVSVARPPRFEAASSRRAVEGLIQTGSVEHHRPMCDPQAFPTYHVIGEDDRGISKEAVFLRIF